MPTPTHTTQSNHPQVIAYIALGANLGDIQTTLATAAHRLSKLPLTTCTCISPLYQSKPIDSDGPDYVNGVMALQTQLLAPCLLTWLQTIESEAGRMRPYRNAPRTLDLDLLLYGDGRIDSDRLTVPHPRMWQRAFVLRPLADIAPQLVSPEILKTVAHQTLHRLEMPKFSDTMSAFVGA